MIKTIYGSFDGNSWEVFCQVCLKLKYESEGYQELPAWQGKRVGTKEIFEWDYDSAMDFPNSHV